jgi:hypothetical protein
MSRSTTVEQDTVEERWEDLPESVREAFESRDSQDMETLRVVHQDLQQALERHIQALKAISRKSLQIIRLNGIILTILLAASSQVRNLDPYTNWATNLGLGLLLLSTLIALFGYRSVDIALGTGPEDAKFTLRAKMVEKEYLEKSIRGNIRWIEEAEEKNRKRGRIVDLSLRVFVAGLVLFIFGISTASSIVQVL